MSISAQYVSPLTADQGSVLTVLGPRPVRRNAPREVSQLQDSCESG